MNWHFMIDTVARVGIVYPFFKSGLRNIRNPQPAIGMISSKKWPFPQLIYAFTILLLFAAPVMIVTYFFDALAALGLFIFTLLCNIFFCNYWKIAEPKKHMAEFLFDANLAIMGGLLLIIARIL